MITVIFHLSPQSKEVGVQLQEDLIKVLNELYTVRKGTIIRGLMFEIKISCIIGDGSVLISALAVGPYNCYNDEHLLMLFGS